MIQPFFAVILILTCGLQIVDSQSAFTLSCPQPIVNGTNLLKCTIDTAAMNAEGCNNIGAAVLFSLTLPSSGRSTVCTTSRATCDTSFNVDGCRCVNSTDFEYRFPGNSGNHEGGNLSCSVDCLPNQVFSTNYTESCENIFVEPDCINCTCTQCNCTLTPEEVTGIVVGIEILIGAIGIIANILRYYEKPNIHRGYYIAAFVIFNVLILIDVIVGPVVYTNQDCCKVNCCEDNCCEDSNCQYDCCKFSTGLIVTILLPTVAVIGALTVSFIICLLKWNCQCCEGSNIGPRDNISHETQPSIPESRAAIALVTKPAPEPEKNKPKLETESGRANGQETGAVHNGADNNSPKKKKKRKPEKETTEMTGLKETSSPSDEEPVMRPLPQPITGDNATPRLSPLPSSGGLTSVERNSYAESQPRKLPLPDIAPSNKE